MRILFVKPRVGEQTLSGGDFVELEPLELEYLAANLTHHDVELIDMRFSRNLKERIARFQPHVVAITAYTVHVYQTLRIAQTAKQLNKDIFTVVGGHHATLMPRDFQRKEIDAVVLGEGVITFRELVEALELERSLVSVPGLALNKADGLFFTESRNDLGKIDQFPFPDRTLSGNYRSKYYYLWWKPAALMRASAGCAFRCSFCPIWKAARGKWCDRSAENIAEELESLQESFVYFADDNAFFNSRKMTRLYRLIKAKKIAKEYFFFSRPDTIVQESELIEQWADIGLRQIFLGIEFTKQRYLNSVNKNMPLTTSKLAVEILKTNGIEPFVGFMVLPEFTKPDFDRIDQYMESLGIYFNEITIMTPSPGSNLYWEKQDQLITHNYDLFDFLHAVVPTRLPAAKFYTLLANLYIRAYSPLRALHIVSLGDMYPNLRFLIESPFYMLKNYLSIRHAHKSATNSQP